MFLLIYEEKYGGVVLSCKVQKTFATFLYTEGSAMKKMAIRKVLEIIFVKAAGISSNLYFSYFAISFLLFSALMSNNSSVVTPKKMCKRDYK